jgi:protein TonB
VVLLHVLLGYAFITGLAQSVIKKATEDLTTVDIQEPPPPPEEPPPPPPEQPVVAPPPPVVSPPPIVRTPTIAPPQVTTVRVAPPVVMTPTAPTVVAPPPPPAAPVISKAAGPKGNPASWVTAEDYPASALRNEEQGVVGLTFDIDSAGRVQNCRVSSTSGSSVLDDTACKLVTRRGRYTPALDTAGNPTAGGTKTLRFTWKLPED